MTYLSYYDCHYTHDSEGEVIDIHTYNYGRVLTTHGNEMLVMWFNNEEAHQPEDLSEVTFGWCSISSEAITIH